jgi:hypothetical protein
MCIEQGATHTFSFGSKNVSLDIDLQCSFDGSHTCGVNSSRIPHFARLIILDDVVLTPLHFRGIATISIIPLV